MDSIFHLLEGLVNIPSVVPSMQLEKFA
jgi:hypothetical protein